MPLFLSDVVEKLRDEGLPATPAKVRYSIMIGAVDRPPMNGLGCFSFSDLHVDQLRAYLRKPKRRGRRPRSERLAAQP